MCIRDRLKPTDCQRSRIFDGRRIRSNRALIWSISVCCSAERWVWIVVPERWAILGSRLIKMSGWIRVALTKSRAISRRSISNGAHTRGTSEMNDKKPMMIDGLCGFLSGERRHVAASLIFKNCWSASESKKSSCFITMVSSWWIRLRGLGNRKYRSALPRGHSYFTNSNSLFSRISSKLQRCTATFRPTYSGRHAKQFAVTFHTTNLFFSRYLEYSGSSDVLLVEKEDEFRWLVQSISRCCCSYPCQPENSMRKTLSESLLLNMNAKHLMWDKRNEWWHTSCNQQAH